MTSRLCAFLATLPVLASAQTPLAIVQPTQVVVNINTSGSAYFIDAEVGLPHEVVEEIRNRKFDKAPQDYGMVFTLDITRTTARYRPPATSAPENSVDAKEVTGWDARRAERLDAEIKVTEDRLPDRAKLLSYAARHNSDPAAREIRVRQLTWLILNRPAAEVLLTPVALIDRNAEPDNYNRIRALWLDLVGKPQVTSARLAGALNFLRLHEPQQVEALLAPTRMAIKAPELGQTYVLSALGAHSLNPQSGDPESMDLNTPAAIAAQQKLSQSRDYILLDSATTFLSHIASNLKQQNRLPTDVSSLYDSLLKQVQALNPDRAENAASLDAKLTRAKLKNAVRPNYPLDARQLGIQGNVYLDTHITKTGNVDQAELRRGHLSLYNEARQSVMKWKYDPFQLDGKPVDVITEIEVNFALVR